MRSHITRSFEKVQEVCNAGWEMVRGWAGCWEIFPSLMAWWQIPGLQVPPQMRFSQEKLPVQALPTNQAGSQRLHSQRISGTPQGCPVPQPQPLGVSPGNKPESGGVGPTGFKNKIYSNLKQFISGEIYEKN